MNEFTFHTTTETQRYCEAVVYCLIKYCGKQAAVAVALVNQFWQDEPFEDDDFRLHEMPYYWAMAIAHHPVLGDNIPEWWRDARFWPPPQDFLDYWRA